MRFVAVLLLRRFCFCVRDCCCCGCFPPPPANTAGDAKAPKVAGILSPADLAPPPPPLFVDIALAARLGLTGFREAPANVTPRCRRFSLFCFPEGVLGASLGFFVGLLDGEGRDVDIAGTCGGDGAGGFWSRERCKSECDTRKNILKLRGKWKPGGGADGWGFQSWACT